MRIGEVAELVGTTTRAIRHYHRIGLVPEPPRRANGYREYGVDAVLHLLRVRRLVRLGVGLDDAHTLLREQDERSPREVLQALDDDLAQQQARLQARRERVRALLAEASQDDPLQHPDLVALVAELHAAFPGSTAAALEHQALDLISHLAPEQLPAVLAEYRAVLADPERLARARDVDRRFAGLADRSPDDAEVEAVARLLLASAEPLTAGADGEQDARSALALELLTDALAPAQRRCLELVTALVQDSAP